MNTSAAGKKITLALLAAAAGVFLILLVSSGEKVDPELVEFSPTEARIDLADWSFEEDGPVRIVGNTWEFYWNRLYTPEDFRSGAAPEEPVLVTGGEPWNELMVDGEKLTADGYASYRAVLVYSHANELFAFYIKNQDSAYRLWINGELLAENGVVAKSEEEYLAQRLPRQFSYQAPGRELEIVVQIANFTHKWGGLTNNIYAGSPEQIQSFVNGRNATIMFLAGAICIIALYHLFLFLNWRFDRAPLYFSLFCASVFFGYLFTGDYVFFRLFPSFPLGLGIRLHYLSLFAALPFFLLFIYSVYPLSLNRIIVLAPAGAAVFLMALALFSPLQFFGAHTLNPYYLLVLIGAGITVVVIIRALAAGQDGAVLSLIGFMIFILTVFYDIAANRKIIVGSALSPFLPGGLFVLILFQSFILANRISRAYERLDHLANNLEHMVASRTADLEQARAKLFEQETLAALGTLAGGIYHEIFNPLSGISGPLSVIKKKLLAGTPGSGADEQIRRNIDYMETNVKKITAIVNNLNNLIHNKQIKKEPVRLLPLVREVTESISAQSDRRIEFSIVIEKEDTIFADKNVLREILDNLVSNAVEAVESEGRVSVRLEGSGTDRRLIVEDDGRGMSPEEASRAGNPFYTTKESSGGSGLGLFLVKQFAANFGWELSVDSRQGRGTRVTIILAGGPKSGAPTGEVFFCEDK